MLQVRPRLLQVERRFAEARTPGTRLPGIRRLIVVRHDRLGDLVLSLPAVAALRATYPEARLAMMVQPGMRPLVARVEGVDEILDTGVRHGATRRKLEGFRADLVVCISRGHAVAWAAVRARIPRRVGSGYRWYSPLFTRRVGERRREGKRHELEYALSFAHRLGAAPGPPVHALRLSETAAGETGRWLEANGVTRPFVVLHPGSGGSCPAWPLGHYLRLAEILRAEGLDVVFSVGPADGAVLPALDGAPAALRELPRFSGGLEGLAALLERAAVVTTNSTGPLHLAAALGTDVLGFYPPWSSCAVTRWGPYSDNGWALVADNPAARTWSRRSRLRHGATLMGGIPPSLAAACVVDLVGGTRPRLSDG